MERDLVDFGRPEAATLLGPDVDDGRAGERERRAQRLQERVQVVTRHDPDVGQPEVLEQLAGLRQAHDRSPDPARPLEDDRPHDGDPLHGPVVGALALTPGGRELDLRQVARHRADAGRDRHLVVVDDDQHLRLALADVVERLERQSAHQRGVPDHDRDALHPVADVARLGQPLSDREPGPGMPAVEDVVRRFGASREPADAIERAQRPESIEPAGEELVRVGLVPGVPDDLVARRFEEAVERDRQFHDPERRTEVAARDRDGVDDRLADLGREFRQLVLVHAAQVGRALEFGQQGHDGGRLRMAGSGASVRGG